jgi:hypothetical protein
MFEVKGDAMAQALHKPTRKDKQLQAWTQRVQKLVKEIATWARAEGWQIQQGTKTLQESPLGTYDVPTLQIHLPAGDLLVNPIALDVVGADGRVDLEAFPTLNRVKLVGKNGHWRIITDSNVPLSEAWGPELFAQLAKHLLS